MKVGRNSILVYYILLFIGKILAAWDIIFCLKKNYLNSLIRAMLYEFCTFKRDFYTLLKILETLNIFLSFKVPN